MIQINILDLLKKENKSKYWLKLNMNMTSRNLNRMIRGETISISYKNMNELCKYLNCTPGDIFTYIEDPEDELTKI